MNTCICGIAYKYRWKRITCVHCPVPYGWMCLRLNAVKDTKITKTKLTRRNAFRVFVCFSLCLPSRGLCFSTDSKWFVEAWPGIFKWLDLIDKWLVRMIGHTVWFGDTSQKNEICAKFRIEFGVTLSCPRCLGWFPISTGSHCGYYYL